MCDEAATKCCSFDWKRLKYYRVSRVSLESLTFADNAGKMCFG